MAILESDGWKYYAEFVKAYAPNASGQTVNEDPTPTTLELDNIPAINQIPGLGNASLNQITLPSGLDYLIVAMSQFRSASANQMNLIGWIQDITSGVRLPASGPDNPQSIIANPAPLLLVRGRTGVLGSSKVVEFQCLKKGQAAAASDVNIARDYPSLGFSNSTSGLDVRTVFRIWAK